MRCVRHAFPEAEVHFATKEAYQDVVKHNPNIDVLRPLGSEWQPYLSTFKGESFDLLIDLHKNIRTKMLKSVLQVGTYVTYNKRNWSKWLLVHLKQNRLNGYSVNDSYFNGLAAVGVHYDGQGLDVYLGNEVAAMALPSTPYVAVVLGAKYATKRAPNEKLDALMSQIEKPVVLIGGESEKKLSDFLTSKHDKVSSRVGEATLLESGWLLKNAHSILTHDTGMMHIAAAFDKDMAVLWGSSVKEFGFSPLYREGAGARVTHFVQDDLACRPCSKLGKAACPKAHFKCMNDHDYTRVAAFLNR